MNPIDPSASSLLVVDVQRGFTELCPGELPVPGGLDIVPKIHRLFEMPWARIDASQDWHPPDHASFAASHRGKHPFEQIDLSYGLQTLWPAHCVQQTH